MTVLGTINITERQMAFEKKPNCKFTCAQVIQMNKTKYVVDGEEMTAMAIASAMTKKRAVKYSHAHKFQGTIYQLTTNEKNASYWGAFS